MYASLAMGALPPDNYQILVGSDKAHYDAVALKLETLLHQVAAGETVPAEVSWPIASFYRDSLTKLQFIMLAGPRQAAQ